MSHPACFVSQQCLQVPFVSAAFDGGRSLAGLASKKPLGFNRNPMYAVGITG